MAVILKNMNMPGSCAACPFSERLDNMRVFCKWHPSEPPQVAGVGIQPCCPLESVDKYLHNR